MTFSNLLGGLTGGGGGIGALGGGDAVGRGLIRLGVDTTGLKGAAPAIRGMMGESNQAAQQGAQQGSKTLSTAFGIAKAGAIALGTTTVATLGTALTAAVNYETAFAGVIKTVDASPAVLERLRRSFRDMSKEIPISASEFAALGETAGALGVHVDDIEEFARITALLGVTTDVSSQQAATSLGQLGNVLGLRNEDYERFGSTLVDLGNKGASTESQILEMAARAGAGGKLIGLSTAQVLGFSSAMANMGIEVEAGGSSLQNFFVNMLRLVSAGGAELEGIAETAGVTAAEFTEMFEGDPAAALQKFIGGLGDLDEAAQLAVLEMLGFNDIRITRALLGMASNTDNLDASLRTANEAWEENNALQIEADKRFETTASQLKILQNRIGDVLLEVGGAMLPVFRDIVMWASERVPEALQYIGTVWNTTVGPAVGRMVEAFGGLLSTFMGIFTGQDEVTDWGALVKGAFDGVADVVAFVADSLSRVIGVLERMLGNEMVGQLVEWATLWAGIALSMGLIRRAMGTVLGGFRGAGRALVMPFVPAGVPVAGDSRSSRITAAASTADVAEDFINVEPSEALSARKTASASQFKAAAALQEAALALKGAASALTAAGAAGALPGAVPGAAPLRGIAPGVAAAPARPFVPTLPFRREAAAAAQMMTGAALAGMKGGFPTVVGAPPVRDLFRHAKQWGGDLVRGTVREVGTGLRTSVGVMQAGRNVFGAGRALISGAVGAFSKLFWPSLIVMMVGDIVAQPVGRFVADTLGQTNLGAEIQSDWMGAIGTWLTGVLKGVDVEKIANLGTSSFTVGDVTIDRVEAAKMGLSRATMETLFAEEATLEGRILQIQVAKLAFAQGVAPRLADIQVPELELPALDVNIDPHFREQAETNARIQLGLAIETMLPDLQGLAETVGGPEFWQEILDEVMGDRPLGEITQTDVDAIAAMIRERHQASITDAEEDLREAVGQALIDGYGFTQENVQFLTDKDIQEAALMIEQNATGELNAWFANLLNEVNSGVGRWQPPENLIDPTGLGGAERFVGADRIDWAGRERRRAAGLEGTPATEAAVDTFDRIRQDAEEFRGIMRGEGEGAARDWLAGWSDRIGSADTKEEQTSIINELVADGQLAWGSGWEDVLQLVEEKQRLGSQRILAQGAEDWLDLFSERIRAAAENTDLQKILEDELDLSWEEILATEEAAKALTGETSVMTMATAFGELMKAASDQGVDLSKEPWAQDTLELIKYALDSGRLTPAAEAELEVILRDAYRNADAAVKPEIHDTGYAQGVELTSGIETGVTVNSEIVHNALHGAMNPGPMPQWLVTLLQGYGGTAMLEIIHGINMSQYDPALAMANRIKQGATSGVFADSPVRKGPLKDPFLPNIGRRLMQRINVGIEQEGFHVPEMEFPTVSMPGSASGRALGASKVGAGAGAGPDQKVFIDRAYFQNEQDEASLLARTRFLLPRPN